MDQPDTPSPDHVPPPRTHGRWWQPPEARWAGRLVFAVAGFVVSVLAFYLASVTVAVVAYDSGGWLAQAAFLVLPWLGLAAVIVLRVRRGTAWRWLSYLAGMLLTVVLPVVLVFGWLAWDALRHMRDFDAQAWRAQSGSWGEDRVEMVDDLMETTPLVGRPVVEIDALLGPDDGEDGTGNWSGSFAERERVWHLGPQRGLLAWDSEFLVLDVDEKGVITAADVVTR